MSTVVLDTNVVSYLLKRDSRAELYRKHVRGNTLALSFMTVAELHEWGFRRKWSEKRFRALEEFLRDYVVIPYSRVMCSLWGKVRFERRSRPISVSDAWIAATALTCDCPLVTHNPRDFRDTPGLSVITEHDG